MARFYCYNYLKIKFSDLMAYLFAPFLSDNLSVENCKLSAKCRAQTEASLPSLAVVWFINI